MPEHRRIGQSFGSADPPIRLQLHQQFPPRGSATNVWSNVRLAAIGLHDDPLLMSLRVATPDDLEPISVLYEIARPGAATSPGRARLLLDRRLSGAELPVVVVDESSGIEAAALSVWVDDPRRRGFWVVDELISIGMGRVTQLGPLVALAARAAAAGMTGLVIGRAASDANGAWLRDAGFTPGCRTRLATVATSRDRKLAPDAEISLTPGAPWVRSRRPLIHSLSGRPSLRLTIDGGRGGTAMVATGARTPTGARATVVERVELTSPSRTNDSAARAAAERLLDAIDRIAFEAGDSTIAVVQACSEGSLLDAVLDSRGFGAATVWWRVNVQPSG